MAIFNSYVKLPEGSWKGFTFEASPTRVVFLIPETQNGGEPPIDSQPRKAKNERV